MRMCQIPVNFTYFLVYGDCLYNLKLLFSILTCQHFSNMLLIFVINTK